MSLRIIIADEAKRERDESLARGTYVADRRLVLTRDGRVVDGSSSDADGWLYAIPGQEIPLEEALRYGLVKAAEPAEDKSIPRSAVEDKSVPGPAKRKR